MVISTQTSGHDKNTLSREEFIDECQPQFKSVQMVAPDNRGDHFVFKKGKIEDPKQTGIFMDRADKGTE